MSAPTARAHGARAPHARLDDGYGEQPNPDEWLQRIEPFIGIVAAERTPAHIDRADVRQEARIAVWRALEKKPADPRPYLIATVKQRTTGVVVRQDWTGQPSQQGKASVDPLRRTDRDSIDQLVEDHGAEFIGAAADALDRVEEAYHHGQVHDAIAGLSQAERQYVLLRFWHGYTEPEIAAKLGVNASRVNNLWNRDARPKLADALADLRDRNLVDV